MSRHAKRQILNALRLYRLRNEFDGSIASARECLELAEYEWTVDLAAFVQTLC